MQWLIVATSFTTSRQQTQTQTHIRWSSIIWYDPASSSSDPIHFGQFKGPSPSPGAISSQLRESKLPSSIHDSSAELFVFHFPFQALQGLATFFFFLFLCLGRDLLSSMTAEGSKSRCGSRMSNGNVLPAAVPSTNTVRSRRHTPSFQRRDSHLMPTAPGMMVPSTMPLGSFHSEAVPYSCWLISASFRRLVVDRCHHLTTC